METNRLWNSEEKMTGKIILDTSILMTPHIHGIDIFRELERLGFTDFLVPEGVFRELKKCVEKKRGKERIAAKVGLELASMCRRIEGSGEDIDNLIIELAMDSGSAIATNDRELRIKAKKKGIDVVGMRGLSHLDFL
jgi:hypothetical protein